MIDKEEVNMPSWKVIKAQSHIESATESVRKFSLSAGFAAKSAKAFVVAWLDGKWVATGNRSSKRKKGVGGKKWR